MEEKDASEAEKAVTEINSGIIAATAQLLKETLPNLSSQNQQGEYYLVDIFAMVFSRGIAIGSVSAAYPEEVAGVNDRHQLAQLERFYQHQQALKLLAAGTTILDPQRFDVRGQLTADRDCLIDINTLFLGRVHLGAGCVIGPNCVLKDCELGAGVSVEANSVLEGCTVGDNSQIGPFARLRPGTELAKTTKVGNFVEIKKSHVGVGTKINHLSYVGDATIGSGVNVGAGTITCNYDGQHKHRTIIENGAFIGSGTQLVAPITIGEDATVGAGSTITKDIPAKALSLTRALQKIFPNWVRRNS